MLCHSPSMDAYSHIIWQACMPKCYYLRLLLTHSSASSTFNFVWTSQYLVFCIQIFDIQPLPPNNSRSTATSWHVLTLLPTFQRLVQRSTKISPAPFLRQESKSSHINNPHQQSKSSNARFLSPQYTSPPTTASSRIGNRHQKAAVLYPQMNAVLLSDGHQACG